MHATAGHAKPVTCANLSHVVGGRYQWKRGDEPMTYSIATINAQRCGFAPVADNVTIVPPNAAHTAGPIDSIIPIAIAATTLSPYVMPLLTLAKTHDIKTPG